MRLLLAMLTMAALPLSVKAAGLTVAILEPATTAVRVRVAWNHAWRNARNHDAAWVFLNYRLPQGPWRPARVLGVSPSGSPAAVDLAEDGSGAFVYAAQTHRGPVDWQLEFRIDPASITGGPPGAKLEWHVSGVEMVYIPEGPFWLGARDPKSVEMNSFFRSDAAGNPAGLLRIDSEREIQVGPREGALWYKVATPQYQGDGQGPIPAAFPKGFAAFYAMKYELTQGQYAEFLNHIPEQASAFRAIHGGLGYARHRGSIRVENGRFLAVAPERPANWVSWNDNMAFAAWARLRPMTEFEYTKASRGPVDPPAGDFPWGTTSKDRLRRVIVAPVDDLVTNGEADESLLTDATRDVFGASHYWVMDLAGSVWERVVTPANPVGRAFRGSHGTGRVSGFGSAPNADWPKGDEEPGGYGYRGGGYYEHGFNAGEFNPHSPTEWRRFGAWGQGPRSVAYGFRGVRTAPPKPAQ
jgi:formylglycine-generating enzyme required for sulfatase activity